eukprot:scaffold318490_cov32-Tisochrysis_lutea.AAC.4
MKEKPLGAGVPPSDSYASSAASSARLLGAAPIKGDSEATSTSAASAPAPALSLSCKNGERQRITVVLGAVLLTKQSA